MNNASVLSNVDQIRKLFESLSLQDKESYLVGTILNCNNIISDNRKSIGAKVTTAPDNLSYFRLFESVNQFANIDQFTKLIPFTNNNVYKHCVDVLELLESFDAKNKTLGVTKLFESSTLPSEQSIKQFKTYLIDYISVLEKNNDFDRLDVCNDVVLKTKVFAKQPIFVNGFNLFDAIKVCTQLGINDLYCVIFNKSLKQFYFVGDLRIICFDIKTNSVGPYIDPDTGAELKITKTDYMQVIKDEIGNNLLIMFNKNVTEFKFTDNLYSDVSRIRELERLREEHKRKTTVFR